MIAPPGSLPGHRRRRPSEGLRPLPPYAIFCDSLEVFGLDWTGDLLAEFQAAARIDLQAVSAALIGDIGPIPGAVRTLGLTLTELAEEHFVAPSTSGRSVTEPASARQTLRHPPVALSSYRLVDLPEGEGSFWNRFTPTRWPTSAAPLLGRPVVSAETWTWLHSPAFRATPRT